MKNRISKLIDKSLRFHHRDIHRELDAIKKKQCIIEESHYKLKKHNVFWGIAIISVVAGQFYIGSQLSKVVESSNTCAVQFH